MAASQEFTLKELAALFDLPPRTVRYYIQMRLVDRPDGVGKGASYKQRHVEQLALVAKWRENGLSLDGIGKALGQAAEPLPPTPRRAGTVEVCSHLVVADGVEVVLEPGRARLTPEQVREFFRAVTRAYQAITDNKESK